jgi:integrase/recombinase XerD
MNANELHPRLDAYLALREALGLATRATRRLLQDFVAYIEQHSDGPPIRAHLAVDWACRASATRGPSGQHSRLSVARGFLIHLKASLPETEVPDRSLIAAPRRPHPYLFSAIDISRILDGAGRLSPRGSLRPSTHHTLFGLLACTGLRPREARNLLVPDVQLDEPPPRLLIRQTKFHKSRWVPLHPTTAEHLRRYAHLRHALQYDGLSEVFFLSEQGRPLDLHTLHRTFQRLIRRLGITPPPGQRRPTLHAFRHTFAVNRLHYWYEAGADTRALLPNLSVYLGHLNPVSSYWYLTATPELLSAAAQRFARYAGKGDVE